MAFDGTNFFVVSYVGDLILRAQSQIIRPYADGSDDLGSPSFRFDEVYVKTGIKVAGVDTIDANGRLNINAMPRDAAGLIIEAQGAGFYPMYVEPDGRYTPAAHAHAAGDITSGELAIARMPRDTAGLILEAEGAGFYPMYVDPNGRYTPAAHNHSMDDITSGGVTANIDVAKVAAEEQERCSSPTANTQAQPNHVRVFDCPNNRFFNAFQVDTLGAWRKPLLEGPWSLHSQRCWRALHKLPSLDVGVFWAA